MNFIHYVKKWSLIYEYKWKIQKFPLKMEESSFFVKRALNGDEANLYSCCCLKHAYSKPKCYNLYDIQLIFVYVVRTAKTSFRIILQTRMMVDDVKFNSHDNDSHFK